MDQIVNPITGQLNFTKDEIDAINQYETYKKGKKPIEELEKQQKKIQKLDKLRREGVEIEKVLPRVNQDKNLTVHMIPHTHDDVGWLKTYNDYFTGQSWADKNS